MENLSEIDKIKEKYQQVAKMYNGLATKYNSLLGEYIFDLFLLS